jgi:hypothetical protein
MKAGFAILAFAIAFAISPGWAQDGAAERVVPLQDGGKVVLRADGGMSHFDANGGPLPMKEGEVMIAADGNRVMMRGNALWQQIVEQAAYLYGLSSELPARSSAPAERKIDLADGGWIILRANGAMDHFDRQGKRIAMADGVVMTTKDGARILMKSGTLWSSAIGAPGIRPDDGRRSK